MQSTITSKFQTTIPKAVRENLALAVNDTLEWKVDHGKVIVSPKQKNFLRHRNRIKIGKGDIGDDLRTARKQRLEKYR